MLNFQDPWDDDRKRIVVFDQVRSEQKSRASTCYLCQSCDLSGEQHGLWGELDVDGGRFVVSMGFHAR
jgi:hypothetical protein